MANNLSHTDVVIRAEAEIEIFDRPAVETSLALIEEVKRLRKQVSDAGWAADAARQHEVPEWR